MNIRFGATPLTPDEPVPESRGSVAGQGVRAGLLQAGAGLSGLAATGLEAIGANDTAAGMYETSKGLRARGNAMTPDIHSYTQVNDADSLLRYGVGMAAQGAPVIAASLLGAAATRGRAPLAGATAAATPFTAGDLTVRQQEDPTIAAAPAGQRLANALGGGAVNAAVSNAVPLAMVGKLGGQGVRAGAMTLPQNIAMNSAEAIGGNAAAGYVGETINQNALSALNENRDKSMDMQNRFEGAAGGAVVGSAFAPAGIIGQAMHGKKPALRTDGVALPEAGVQADVPAPDAPKPSAIDRIKGAFKKSDEVMELDTADRMAQNQDLIDKAEWSEATPERKGQMLGESDKTFTEKATAWGKKLYEDADLAPETRAKIDDFMANPMDRTKASEVAKAFKDSTVLKQAVAKTREFGDTISKKFDDLMNSDKVQDAKNGAARAAGVPLGDNVAGSAAKKFYDAMASKYGDMTKGKTNSEQFSPKLHSAMADAIAPSLGQRFPGLVQNDAHMRTVTGSMRRVMAMMQATGKLDADTIEQMHNWYGDDAPSVLASLHSTVLDGTDKQATANYFGAINRMVDETANTSSLEGVLRTAMPDMQDASPGAFKELIAGYREHFDGNDAKGRTKEETEFRTREIDNQTRALFGDKAATVMKAFEKDAKRRYERTKADDADNKLQRMMDETDDELGTTDRDYEGDDIVVNEDDAMSNSLNERDVADEFDAPEFLGQGKEKDNPQPVLSEDAHVRTHGGSKESTTVARLIKEAEAKYPDRSVSFVPIKDLPPEVRAKYPNAKPDEGLVTVESMKSETRLTRDEFKQVRVNTKNNAHVVGNKSLIETGVKGAVIDARKLTKLMNKKLAHVQEDDHGARNRMARSFMEGIAAIQDALGKKFTIDDDIVIAPGFTYKDAKEISGRKPDPKWMEGKSDAEINRSLVREENLKEMKSKDLPDALEKAEDVLLVRTDRLAAELDAKITTMREEGIRPDKATVRELRRELDTKIGVKDAEQAVKAINRELERRESVRTDQDENARQLSDEGRTEVDPGENIHRVGGKEARHADADGNALHYDNFESPTRDGSMKQSTRDAISTRANVLRDSKASDGSENKLAARVAKMMNGLVKNVDKLSAEDQAMLMSTVQDKTVKATAETVTPMYAKYKDVLEAQARRFDTDSATKRQISEIAKSINISSGTLVAKYNRLREQYAGKSDAVFTRALAADLNVPVSKIEGLNALYRAEGPSPKKLNAFTSKVLGEGDLAPTLKAIKSSDDAIAVQRAIDALADHLDNPRAKEVFDAAVARIEALIDKDPDVTIRMQSKQRTGSAKINAKDQAAIKKHIDEVLGASVEVEFAKMLHAGEFVRDAKRKAAGLVEDVIRISVHAMDPMGTAFHESMHAFVQKLRDTGHIEYADALGKAADSAFVRGKLDELLANEPDALKQIRDSQEERVAYMYQFWAAGKLALPTKPRTIMQRLQALIHKVMGTWTNDQRATHIMEYFNTGGYAKTSGDPSVVRRVLMEGSEHRFNDLPGVSRSLAKLANATLATGNGRLRATGVKALIELADKLYAPLQGESGDVGYIPAARVKQDQTLNALAEKLRGFTPAQIKDAHNARIKGEMGDTPETRIINRHVQAMLKEMKAYMQQAGVRMGDLGDDYYPRVWDAELVTKNEPAFRAMLKKYQDKGEFAGDPERLIAKFVRGDNGEDLFETVRPGMQHTKVRKLDFITPEDAAPFVERDMFRTVQSYIAQATRRAEWSRRFGDDNVGLTALMKEAKEQGATPEHEALVTDYLKAMDGTLGDHIDPKWRKAFGHMIVYQNIRLLPLMIFSSLIDPGGIAVRGGTVRDSFKALKRGLSEIPKGFKKDAVHDEWTQLATTMGVIEDSVLIKSLGSTYAQGMSNNTGRKVNDTFFKYNLMAQFNTSMRVGATEAAVGFMAKHADGTNSTHSKRWLAELGFKPGEIKLGADGRPLMTVADFEGAGMSKADAQRASDRMAIALNKWVDGAILRPNAAHKPIWMNDPHFALFSHLKQFVYSFQETILKRVINEAKHGNVGPMYALAAYVPFMIAADVMKGMLVSGGGVPDNRENWDLVDYLGHGVQRAGLLGVGQIGVDVAKDIHRGGVGLGAVVGPSVEQMGDAVSVVGGTQQFGTFVNNALPANQLLDAADEAVTGE